MLLLAQEPGNSKDVFWVYLEGFHNLLIQRRSPPSTHKTIYQAKDVVAGSSEMSSGDIMWALQNFLYILTPYPGEIRARDISPG